MLVLTTKYLNSLRQDLAKSDMGMGSISSFETLKYLMENPF